MQWFRVQQNTNERKRIYLVLQQLRWAVRDKVGVSELYADLFKRDGVPAFFQAMFDTRGDGGSFYGRTWAALTPKWVRTKMRKGWDPRIGHRKLKLVTGMTEPGSQNNTFSKTVRGTIKWGAHAIDKGRKYAGYFNAKRPVIDEQAMLDLQSYMTAGAGASVFNTAVAKFKLSVAQKAVAGQRRNRYGNIFPQ